MIENLMRDTVTIYLAPTYADDASGGPNITANGSGTTVNAHVGVNSVNLASEDNRQEGEYVQWDVLVLMSDVTPNMGALVRVDSIGGNSVNKLGRILDIEPVGTQSALIPGYWAITVGEVRETS